MLLAGTKLPQDLAEHPQDEPRVSGGEVQAPDEASELFFSRNGCARLQIAARAESIQKNSVDAIEVAGGRRLPALCRLRRMRTTPGDLIEADGDGLAEIH